MKNLIVEEYDPAYMSFDNNIMLPDKMFNPSYGIGLLVLAILIAASMVHSPYWLFGILVLPVCTGFLMEPPITRKRKSLGSVIFHRGEAISGWYRDELIETNDMYRQQIIDYFDYIRAGGTKNREIESELKDWVDLEKKYALDIKERKMKQDASPLSRRGQIDEYEKMLKEITQ